MSPSLWIATGIAIGVEVGAASGNLAIGIAAGVALGTATMAKETSTQKKPDDSNGTDRS